MTDAPLDRPLGAAGRAVVDERHAAADRPDLYGRADEQPRELASGTTPGGLLQVLLDPSGTGLTALLDGDEVARLRGPGLLTEPSPDLALQLGDEPAALGWDAARPGAWARPRTLTVRWRRSGWLLVAHSGVRELHPAGRGDGAPLVRLSLDDGSGTHRLAWSALATGRDLALAELLVLGLHPRAFSAFARG